MIRFSPITKRLMPLYIGGFLQGTVFWYAIEKLFMTSIGFSATTIGLMVSTYSVVVLLLETPSGLIADRWSRKSILMLASIALAISSLLAGISTDVTLFLIAMMFWGAFAALSSGTYDSVIYDTLIEEQGNSKQYKLYYGRNDIISGISLVAGALVGGVIATQIGMRETFFYTIPIALLSIIFFFLFKEPVIHKAESADPVLVHIKYTLSSVLRNKALVPLLVSLVAFVVIGDMMFEFSQLWFIASSLPIAFFGIAYAVVLSSLSVAGYLAKVTTSNTAMLILPLLIAISTLLLIFTRNPYFLVMAEFILCTIVFIYNIHLTHQLHDNLPSKIRAGSSSAISTIARLFIIPLALLFGGLSETHSVYFATWIMLFIAAIAVLFLFINFASQKRLGVNLNT